MDETPLILAIDTSTDQAGIALARGADVLEERLWRPGQNQTVELLPAIARILSERGLSQSDLGALAVARGPGSFSGLRVALATAKGLALALDLPIVGIGTLEVEAFPYRASGRTVCPVLDAGRGDIYVALFSARDAEWTRLWEEQIAAPEEVAARVPVGTMFCGEIPEAARDVLSNAGRGTLVAPDRPRSAAALAVMAWARLARGERDDVATLQPLYIRRPAVTTRRKP